ncbi:MAG: hypothetical protein A2622_11025 [Bdellovibrionales bacterium RIFCSPHIGHO2_01_FULL_40_29]|nr:MAG: hypothetical protein A2622_11025 [Bdellovibrionales bacterium RIFCSPHIGHO2_01_FULL_40_29]OFZ34486.1 MAG: hypothetical protein A3D17_01290 [Bdellovibrionales bacterium RIFCSPHIGHO2_02_FULL_40_15]
MRVADYIAEHLEKIGVRAVFLLSGGGMMHLLDAASRKDTLKYICNHHEQCSGMAADAYARVTSQLGVCYATSGPGGTNTLTAVVGAYQDSSPVLFISGQSKLSQTIEGTGSQGLRQFGTFEVDVIPTMKSVTKYAEMVTSATDIRYHLEKAIYLAMEGRPGPVFLDIPLDIQGAPIEVEKLRGFDPAEIKKASVEISSDQIKKIVQRLTTAKKPLILAGYGVRASNSVNQLLNIVRMLNIPVVTTSFGSDVVAYDNPLFVGHPGLKGDRPGNFAIQTADVILSVGCSLHVTTTGYELDKFAPDAYKILVDPDPFVLKREQVNVNEKVQMDVKLFLNKLESISETLKISKTSEAWIDKCREWKNNYSTYKEPHKHEDDKINFYDFSEKLDQAADANDIIVTDAGSAFYIFGQAFRYKQGQRLINSGSLGAMGFALPAATGAALGDPNRRILCVTGDGSLQTNLHELAVYKKNKLNIKLFVINNDGYVCIRNTQTSFFSGHLAGTSESSGVWIPNLKKTADAFELPFFTVDNNTDLALTIEKVFATPGPVFCEIITPNTQEIIPTVSSVRLPNGSMKSKPLHEMFPFMSEEEASKTLIFEQ